MIVDVEGSTTSGFKKRLMGDTYSGISNVYYDGKSAENRWSIPEDASEVYFYIDLHQLPSETVSLKISFSKGATASE